LQAGAQGGKTLGHAIGGHVHIGPQGLVELHGGNDLPGMSQQEPERGQLFGREVKRSFSAEESAIGFEPEAGKRESGRSSAGQI